jgi:hypothetical protein
MIFVTEETGNSVFKRWPIKEENGTTTLEMPPQGKPQKGCKTRGRFISMQ